VANLTYFLKAVIPVAKQPGLKCVAPGRPAVSFPRRHCPHHPQPEAYDRMFDIAKSDYNGMVFCIGALRRCLIPKASTMRSAVSYGKEDRLCPFPGHPRYPRQVRRSLSR